MHKADSAAELAGMVSKSGGPDWMFAHRPRYFILLGDFAHVGLAGLQCYQPPVAVVGDGDNSLSMRSVKLGAYGAIYQASSAAGLRSRLAPTWMWQR